MLSVLSTQRWDGLVGERQWDGMDRAVGVGERSGVAEQSMYGERSGFIGSGVGEQRHVEFGVDVCVGIFREQECPRASV